jgi:hypothetical protein
LVAYHAYNRCDGVGCRDMFASVSRVLSGTASGYVASVDTCLAAREAREAREAESRALHMAEVFRFYLREHPTSRVILSGDHGPHFSLSPSHPRNQGPAEPYYFPWNEGSTERVGENTCELEEID